MLAFLKGLHARSIHSLSETQFHDAMTVFKILTLATNKLVLARHSETQHDEQIKCGAHVGVSMEGQIQIQVGDYDYKTHLGKTGRANVRTPVTNAHLVCRLRL